MAKATPQDKPIRIIRVEHNKENPYFMMSRQSVQDRDLSWEARGVLAYLLSQPDNWQVQIANLQQNCGRDKVRKIIDELIAAHYLTVTHKRKENGSFAPAEYKVHETPCTENPLTDNPSTDYPSTANPPQQNRELENPESQTTEQENTKTLAPNGAGAVSDPVATVLAEGKDNTPNPDADTPAAQAEELPVASTGSLEGKAENGEPLPDPNPPVPLDPPSPKFNVEKVFDCVAWGSFGIKDLHSFNETEKLLAKKERQGSRIGALASTIKKLHPGLDEKVIAGKVVEFYQWFRSTHDDISAPRVPVKFIERWMEWEQRHLPAPDTEPPPDTSNFRTIDDWLGLTPQTAVGGAS